MRFLLLCFLVTSCFLSIKTNAFGQSTLLDNAQTFSTDFLVNDAVYDPTRDVVFASVPSSQGANFGNQLVEIDPSNGSVLNSTFVGSEPNQLAIAADGSRVYIGIDGAQGVRYFEPGTGNLGAIQSLTTQFGPAVAEDLAVSPGFPNSVVVSRDTIGSSASGSLEIFTDQGSTFSQGFASNDLIDFIDFDTLFSLNISNTGFDANTFDFDGQTITSDQSQDGVISVFNTEAEASRDGLINFTNGLVLDPATLNAVGTFNTNLDNISALVESVPESGLTYFVGPESFQTSALTLRAFDSQTFVELDSIALSGLSSNESRGELITAGVDTLAIIASGSSVFDFEGRTLTFVSGIPVGITSVPEPSAVTLLAFGALAAISRRKR